MRQQGDIFVLILIVIAGVVALLKWLKASSPIPYKFKIPRNTARIPEDLADVLEYSGFQMLSGKNKYTIRVSVDDVPLKSRLFVDGFAKQGKNVYVVKVARDVDLSDPDPNVLRDRLLPYVLMFEGIAGILLVDVGRSLVRKVSFQIDGESYGGRKR